MRLVLHTREFPEFGVSGLLVKTPCFTKIGLRLARRVRERHEHLLLVQLAQSHVVLHDGVAAGVAVVPCDPIAQSSDPPDALDVIVSSTLHAVLRTQTNYHACLGRLREQSQSI